MHGDQQAPRQGRGRDDEAKGRVKEAAGALTGNRSKQDEGAADRLSGKLKNKKGP